MQPVQTHGRAKSGPFPGEVLRFATKFVIEFYCLLYVCMEMCSETLLIYMQYPELASSLKQSFIDLRKAGLPLNTLIAGAFMKMWIGEKAPQLLEEGGGTLRCSRQFVRLFLRNQLGFSYR